jgi:hypothetical protein
MPAPIPAVASSTAIRPEFSPAIIYVRDRLLQMRDRSRYELQPYPDENLIANAWAHADAIVRPGIPTPSVVPSEDGNVSLVWAKGGWEVEIEIAPRDVEVWADSESSPEPVTGSLETTGQQIVDLLHRLGPSA